MIGLRPSLYIQRK